VGEVSALRWRSVDTAHERLVIQQAKTDAGVCERVLVPVVNRANEVRAERRLARLPKATPHALRRRYISPMLEAGAPLSYVTDQVGHADSETTLEIYAQVRKRASRKNVHAALDRLLNGADSNVSAAASDQSSAARPGEPGCVLGLALASVLLDPLVDPSLVRVGVGDGDGDKVGRWLKIGGGVSFGAVVVSHHPDGLPNVDHGPDEPGGGDRPGRPRA
jgi:hypothetical protein